MAHPIEIAVPVEEIEARRARVAAAKRFEPVDRVPVIPSIGTRFLVPLTGTSFGDYFADPVTMLRSQILGQKWLLEHVRTDAHDITGAWVGAWTDFQNTFEAGSLGVPVVFPDDDIPWVGPGWVRGDADLPRLAAMDFAGSGLNARQREFRRRMIEAADDFSVRFLGGPVFHPGANPSLTHTSDGPFGVAGDLCGPTELFAAVRERPAFVRELLRVVTDHLIAWLDVCRREEGLASPVDFAWTDDLAAGLSAEDFRDVVLPSERRLREHFDGRVSLHMCGRTDHLLGIFRDDLAIHEFQGFGYETSLRRVAATLGGRVTLLGNVDPMLIRFGTPGQVREASRRVLEALAPTRGLILQDGNNIPPGSPLENINAMMDASEAFGRP